MKKLLIISIILINIFAYTLHIKPGWQLKGALTDILVSELNNSNIKAIWCYDDDSKKWQLYSPTDLIDLKKYNIEKLIKINKEQGFWIYSDKYIDIETYNKIYDDNYTKFLIDKPKKFGLNDIAGKTFKIINSDGISDLTFDNDGNSKIIFWDRYNIKYENGVINFYNEDGKLISNVQKIKEDNNGVVILETFYNTYSNNLYIYHRLNAWLFTDPSIINISSLLPITLYGSKGEILKLDSNYTGTLLTSFGKKFTCKIKDNDIIINNNYSSYDNTYGYNWKKDFKFIKKIDRYYVLLSTINESYWCFDSNLKGKTFDDLIGSKICINDGIFYNEGYPLSDFRAMYYKLNNDGTITNDTKVIYTYKKIDSNTLKIFDDNTSIGILKIDTSTGKITRIHSYSYTQIVSKTPIDTITIKSDEGSEGSEGGGSAALVGPSHTK